MAVADVKAPAVEATHARRRRDACCGAAQGQRPAAPVPARGRVHRSVAAVPRGARAGRGRHRARARRLRRHAAAGLARRVRRPRPALRRPARHARAGRAVRSRRLLAGRMDRRGVRDVLSREAPLADAHHAGRVPARGRQRRRPLPHVPRGALRDDLQRHGQRRRGRARSGGHRRRREGLRGGVDDRAARVGAPRRPEDAAPPAARDDAGARRRRRARPARARRGGRRLRGGAAATPSSCASLAPATPWSSSSPPLVAKAILDFQERAR